MKGKNQFTTSVAFRCKRNKIGFGSLIKNRKCLILIDRLGRIQPPPSFQVFNAGSLSQLWVRVEVIVNSQGRLTFFPL